MQNKILIRVTTNADGCFLSTVSHFSSISPFILKKCCKTGPKFALGSVRAPPFSLALGLDRKFDRSYVNV
jgi:hypothetical protein